MSMTIKCDVHFGRQEKGRRLLKKGKEQPTTAVSTGRVPRISRLMALAIESQKLLESGQVKDYAELARLGHVTRARVTQVMNLLNLAPDLQEKLLFLPLVKEGRDPVKEWMVRPVAREVVWGKQRKKAAVIISAATAAHSKQAN